MAVRRSHGVLSHFGRVFLICSLLAAWSVPADAGIFDTLREDVRPGPSGKEPDDDDDDDDDDHHHSHHHGSCWGGDDCDDDDELGNTLALAGLYVIGAAITSPVWGPHVVMMDRTQIDSLVAGVRIWF